MNQRNAYLIQIIEKIGTPLLTAVLRKNSGEIKEDAQNVAGLLSKTVQLSIDLGHMIEIEKSSPDEIESLRVAMAGLAGPMIANHYEQNAKIPGENEIKKLTSALEAVMTFSDNFSPSEDHVIRLENMKANGTPADAFQINIQYVQAFVPIADVVASFPFGQPEKKLMQDVADRINSKARQIREDAFGDALDAQQKKLCELALVKSLADLYASCHKAEMDKLMAMQDPDAGAQQSGLQALWQDFDTRAEILATLAQNIAPNAGGGTIAPKTAPEAAPATVQQPPAQPEQPAAQPADQGQTGAASGNPMAMFSKPKEGGETPPPAAAPPQQQTPPAAAPQPPPQQEQPAAQPEEKKQESGSPMAFFKSPPKDENEE